MTVRRWGVRYKDKRNLERYEFITLIKLRNTVRKLKRKGMISDVGWSSPIVPLLIEHVLSESNNLSDVEVITLSINEGKDIKAC